MPSPHRCPTGARRLALLLLAAVAMVATLAATAGRAAADIPLNLNSLPSTTYVGNAEDGTQVSVAGDCDVNGDGLDDLLIGTTNPDGGSGRGTPGKAYAVLQGQQSLSGGPGVATIAPVGVTDKWEVGADIACAGDVNQDGTDDLVLGAPGYIEPASEDSKGPGAAFVVFGGSGFVAGATVDIAPLGDPTAAGGGYRIQGEGNNDRFGMSVDAVGDADGDGADDVLIGAAGGDAYLTTVWLSEEYEPYRQYFPYEPILVGEAGVGLLTKVEGLDVNSAVVWVANAGDVDGDEVNDLLLGSQYSDVGALDSAGKAFAISGTTRGTIDIDAEPGTALLQTYLGATENADFGAGLAGAGDVNGDGLDDVIVGSIGDTGEPGSAWVLFSREAGATIDTGALGPEDGYLIEGPEANSRAGVSVAPLGDINGDQVPDHLVGAERYGSGGAAYVVYGQASEPRDISLSALEAEQGARFVGNAALGGLGRRVAFGGTLEGAPTLLLGRGRAATVVTLTEPSSGGGNTGGGSEEVEQADVDWGFRASFRSYVAAGNGSPPIDASNGASCAANPDASKGGCDPKPRASSDSPPPKGALLWTPVGAVWDLEAETAEVTTEGTVKFSYPAHFFTLSIQDPVFAIDGSEVTVEARVDLDSTLESVPSADGRVTLGRFALAAPVSETESTITWETGAGELTPEAATLLGGFLAEGAELDPAYVTIPKALGPAIAPPADADDGDGGGDSATPPTAAERVVVERIVQRLRSPALRLQTARSRLLSPRNRTPVIATVACRQACRVAAPRRAAIKLGGRSYRARVIAPRRLAAGSHGRIRVKVPAGVVRKLRGRRAVVRVKFVVRSGERRVKRTARVKLRAARR